MSPRLRARVLVLAVAASTGACATLSDAGLEGPAAGKPARSERDPFERVNRAVFSFNQTLDDVVLRPVATAYVRFVPEPLQMIAGNFLSNLLDPYIGLNNLLQGKPAAAASDMTRFMLNTVLGFAGFGDPASDMGFRKHNEDFGQTLGVWGFATGPYLVLPLFGPSSLRDGAGFAVDSYTALINRFDENSVRNSLAALAVIDTRAGLLPADRLLEDALDRYLLVRDSYLQRRRSLVHDGDPPDPEEDDDQPPEEERHP
jgi:phospholipid-binding lipoprotein MlaA